MVNLRVTKIKVIDSVTIKAEFTKDLDPLINTSNVVIASNLPGVPDPEVKEVKFFKNIITITTQPLTPYAQYFLTFKSTQSSPFKSKDGSALVLEDGKTNVFLLLGPDDPANPVRDLLLELLKDGPYNLANGDVARDIINNQAMNLARALYDIGQAKNDNYLDVLIENEQKVRGSGPYDRLVEEGAYKIIRVGKMPAGATTSLSFNYDSFPTSPITLLRKDTSNEKLLAGTGSSTFDGLILTVAKHFVTKLNAVRIVYADGSQGEYNISAYGYQVLNDRYDPDFASTFLTLEDNQFKLSDTVLDSSFRLPKSGDFVFVDYESESKGRIVSEDSVVVSQVLDSIREVTPPIQTVFNLAHAPIVRANDTLASTDGVTFLDPEANPPFSDTHPAFTTEIPYRLDGLPRFPGEFSIDYSTGRVFVFGAVTNDGTSNFPPTATYKYRNVFASRLDYTYDPTTSELVASPLRDLVTETVKVSFSYEEALVPGIDYKPQAHAEILDERIENRIRTTASVLASNTPITNVFRVFNETSGEIYKIQRWNDNTIFFDSSTPPRILAATREPVSFTDVLNETLLVSSELTNTLSTQVFKVTLQNNRIMSSSEDVIGSSYNSSATFSRTDIFNTELYFDPTLTETANYDRLLVGQYQIDYRNGLVYVGVSHAQNFDLGTINYKNSIIKPQNSHVISVSDLYNSISNSSGINKKINYSSFGEGEIAPSEFDFSDERFLDNDDSEPYIVEDDTITVTDDIKDVRNIYDLFDLNNHVDLTNFAEGTTITGSIINLDTTGVQKRQLSTVETGLIVSVDFISSGAELSEVTSVVRLSDNVELGVASFSGYDITLSGSGSPAEDDQVLVTYRVKLNGAATPVVDYNRGDYFADYTYLADEILISYEYGDNNIDFRESSAIDEGEIYFVTYRVGALRDALLKNFGSLVDIPILNTFDTTLPRENYRDALKAALQSFTKGPTIPSMKLLVSNITHIDPEIIEAAFQNWSLGISHLHPNPIDYTGDIQLLAAKFDNGALIANPDETITFPVSSNLRLEEGTLETWVIPEWDGLDNDATLTFELLKDGYSLSAAEVFIGADSHNPVYDSEDKFTVNRKDSESPIGLPFAIYTKTGIFIYYDDDFKKWKVLAKDVLTPDGYVYSGNIQSSGEVYDVKFIPGLGEINDVLRSGSNKIDFEFHLDGYDALSPDGYNDGYSIIDGYSPGDGYAPGYSFDGINFMADDEHYIFDFGSSDTTNRFSIYKDGSGYLNFKVFDKGNPSVKRVNQYVVSADISDWKAGDKHHIATTWKLNTTDRRDEMHLFLDGFEVPNIMRYGGRPVVTSSDRFRTVKPEIIIGTVPLNTVAGNDLNTVAGSDVVTSDTINFTSEGIVSGDTIKIKETGFGTYTITAVSANSLTLSSSMPLTLTDARFSVNPFSAIVSTEIDLYGNIAVSIIRDEVETEIPGLRATIPSYEISKNALNQDVLTILGNAKAGDQIGIRTLGLNFRRCRDRVYIWGNNFNVLKTQMPPPILLDEVKIYSVLLPLMVVGPNNSSLIVDRFVKSGITTSQPSNATEGRTLAVRLTGGNVKFSDPPTVTIFGTTAAGPVSETLTFTSSGTQNTSNKWKTISSVTIESTPFINSKDSISVEIKEAYSVTNSEGNSIYPVIRFSYQTQTGSNLEGDGSDVIEDEQGYFPDSSIDQILVISSPAPVAGTYTITERLSNTSVRVSPTPAAPFTSGKYDIFNITLGRSGFQNGYFVLEQAGGTNIPFPLKQGVFEFDYTANLEIPFKPISKLNAYVGSDLNGNKQAKVILDEFRILSRKLTDVRVGETIGSKEDSITTDFTTIRPFKSNSDTLMLLHFDTLPFVNDSDFWVTATKSFLQSGSSINNNFEKSLVITDKPLVIENRGFLTTSSEGTIEFWVSPRFDTYNDPNYRFYFDATGTAVEEVASISNGSVKTSGRISRVLSVRLQTDKAGTGTDYFVGGRLESDAQTIKLGKALPYQQTPVTINYIPSGLTGNRLSIYKDKEGFITLNVRAKKNEELLDYQVRQPIFWSRDSWHRIRVSFKFNRPDNRDEIRLFVDGEERGTILFGSGLLFGQGAIFGQGFAGIDNSVLTGDINFTDSINEFYIGSDFNSVNLAQARIDNFKISNVARTPFVVAGQSKDLNFSSNLDTVFPVIPDAFTTLLLDFNTLISKNDDFALLRNEEFGIFNFTLNVIDSFDIVLSSAKIQQVLEKLISTLKPAQSRVSINYIR